jgi:hypothetical protein
MASVPYRNESLAAILKAGCPVLALAPHSLADIAQDIRLIAAIAGTPQQGEQLVAEMSDAVAQMRRSTADLPHHPRVYCEEWGKPLIHSQLWVRELVEAAGGVFLGEPGAVTTPKPWLTADPDVILAAWCGAGDRVPLESSPPARAGIKFRAVRERPPLLHSRRAAQHTRTHPYRRPRAIASALHPDAFRYFRRDSQPWTGIHPSLPASKLWDRMADTAQIGREPKALRFVAAALILRGEEVLVCQRKAGSPMGLKWEFPGGKIEPGESPSRPCAASSTRNSASRPPWVPASPTSAIPTAPEARSTCSSSPSTSFAGDIVNHIFEDVRWTPLRTLPDYDFLAADRDLIRDLAAGKLL